MKWSENEGFINQQQSPLGSGHNKYIVFWLRDTYYEFNTPL